MKTAKDFLNEAVRPTFLTWGNYDSDKIQNGVWYKTKDGKLQFKITSYELIRTKSNLVDVSIDLVVRVFDENGKDSDFKKYKEIDFNTMNKVLNRLLK
tara:strand:- start:63817 stop:64110 length:294 start_codon:yes stop_codon:yes gene_type:complete